VSSAPAALIATGFLVLAGATAGFVLGRWSVEPPPANRVEVPVPAETKDVSPLLAEIREGQQEILRALRERPTPAPPAGEREPAVADDRLDRIASAVDGLAKRFEEEVADRGRGPGLPNLDAFLTKFRLFEKGLESSGTIRADLLAAHRFWSHQNLLDRYGTPVVDTFQPSGYGRTTYELGAAWAHFDLSRDEVTEVLLVSKE
jgi:hypothetical protein